MESRHLPVTDLRSLSGSKKRQTYWPAASEMKLSFESYLPDFAGAEAGAEFCSTECEPFERT